LKYWNCYCLKNIIRSHEVHIHAEKDQKWPGWSSTPLQWPHAITKTRSARVNVLTVVLGEDWSCLGYHAMSVISKPEWQSIMHHFVLVITLCLDLCTYLHILNAERWKQLLLLWVSKDDTWLITVGLIMVHLSGVKESSQNWSLIYCIFSILMFYEYRLFYYVFFHVCRLWHRSAYNQNFDTSRPTVTHNLLRSFFIVIKTRCRCINIWCALTAYFLACNHRRLVDVL
jgi:hypothetical protein